MDSAYVTRHNFKRLAGSFLQPDGDVSIDKIFSLIYEQSLSDILNHQEATRLYVQKQIFEGKLNSLRAAKRRFTHNYIFSVTPPKFHKYSECEFLAAPFKNYLVPAEIKVLGEEKISEFQEFCEATKKDFEGKPADVFWMHVGARFKVRISPKSVLYENSGIQDVGEMSIEDLHEQIDRSLRESLAMLENPDSASLTGRYRYAPHMESALSKISDPDARHVVEEFFKLKVNIIRSLFELYKKQARATGYVLPVNLLRACGLEPCKGCWK